METEGSSPKSQVPATCPYPVPVQSSSHPIPHSENSFNITLPSTSGSPKWSLSFRFPHQNPAYASPLPHTRYMPRPSHSSPFYHSDNIGRGVQIIQLLIMQFPPLPCYFVPPRPKYFPHHPILEHFKAKWLLCVPPRLTLKNSTLRLMSAFTYFIRLS